LEVEAMLGKIKYAIPIIALLAVFMFITPPQANARVHFGVYVGPTYPAYTYPYAYSYPSPYYTYPYGYGYVYPYGYAYSSPYYYGGRGRHWEHERHEWREHREHHEHGHEFRGHYR
jgi:hypothetical protein